MTNVRIARKIRTEQSAIIKTEIGAEWIVLPSEWPNSPKADYIRNLLALCQSEEPDLGWVLEFRGTESNWHESLDK
jgi:hypothetical protein